MHIDDIFHRYREQPDLLAFSEKLKAAEGGKYQVSGLVGSQQALIVAALYRMTGRSVVVLLNDKEEALYFHNDLKAIMPKKEIFLYPASYKRPYQIEEVDNANILQRAEVLNELNHTRSGRQVIVTFAEALNEKVVNKRSLVRNTLEIKESETCGMDFIVETLEEYGFEREDYVFEPGQFAVRGGILDVFSFAHDLPYRIEFFGEEIESIRTFDPVTQMSEKKVQRISLIPNIQRQLTQEKKVSFLEYISPRTLVFAKSVGYVEEDLARSYDKAVSHYHMLRAGSGDTAISREPEKLYYAADAFRREMKDFAVVELARASYYKLQDAVLSWKGNPQPAFHKAFQMLADHFRENEEKGIENYVLSDSEKQIQRLEEIFEEIDQRVHFSGAIGELHEGFVDPQLNMAIYTDHQIFDRYHRYKSSAQKARSQALTLHELRDLNPGDYVVHVHHGIGKFAGLHDLEVGEHRQEAAKIMYKNGDAIFVNVNALHKITKYTGKEGVAPKLSKIGSSSWARATAKTKKRIKELAFDLVSLYARRQSKPAFAFSPDSYMQQELEASFMYEDTPDQLKSTDDVKADMEKAHPMDRLVCGDVGFGKTEVAIRAAFKAAVDGKQTAVLVPTTILALQHARTFAERLKDMPVTVDYINRFKSTAKQKETLKRVSEGKVDILIGTHRIVSKDVKFKDLGLLIIDEEQRFGVNVKDKLKLIREEVDTLTLTATPIPRTLQFSLAGIRDMSLINTPPPNRRPIETEVTTYSEDVIRDAISYELKRGGQVFFIHPRVRDIEEVAAGIKRLVPDARIAIGHGQMTGNKLEKVMMDFIEGTYDVLVATTIIESGLDIPNANTIIINQANLFGLSDLHQMRGRVGRSNRKAFCYLIAPPEISRTAQARKRLKVMEEFSELGSGIQIALKDLDLRGTGDLLGAEQSGFITEIGYDMYHQILEEAILELKEEHFEDLFAEELSERKKIFVDDCKIDIDLEIRLPEDYMPRIPERLRFYRRISGAMKEEELREVQREILDRFGAMPAPVLALFDATRIRDMARRLGIERVYLKRDDLRFFFIADQSSEFYKSEVFGRIISYVQTFTGRVQMKQSPKFLSLIFGKTTTIKEVLEQMMELHEFVFPTA